MPTIRGGVGSFLLRRAAPKSIRQKYQTGPQFYKRKFFHFPKGHHRLHRRISGMQMGSPTHQREHERFNHLPGDVRTKPQFDFTFGEKRADGVLYAWRKRGDLQLYQVGGKTETFVCYRCGYPVRSQLVAIKADNWDYRMCYRCYTTTVNQGMENDT
ncbi:uncharacterized protein TM35_000031360 [Trypanosoma theileri]|uniref:Uncharacterized protein n=1 Tax=Trypanosoma theileri TaxID=67003 RepID=A0A1X0P6W6_9TRYP|nr:uncharacterized protein TM35_000031360 [Trypanosoma theileri]ORC92383.1 hypothetical protein TM35_000031360 [Trypanosoma theileri]